jgi:transcriptional regulator with XRE-family HTH domain
MLLNGSQDARDGVGERLRLLRTSKGWSQDYVAKRAGVTPLTVSRIEIGKRRRPHFTTLNKIADALGVEVSDLAYDPDPDNPMLEPPPPARPEPWEGYREIARGLLWNNLAFTRSTPPDVLRVYAHELEYMADQMEADGQ